MASEEGAYSNAQVLYQLSWEGKIDQHLHMITVQYPSDQDGLRLRDVKKRLTTLRGQGIGHSFSWSYKRNYRSTFIWNDLSDDDLIHPLRGSGEYVLKASQLIDAVARNPAENRTEYQNEQKHGAFCSQVSNQALDRHSRTSSADELAKGAERSCEDDSTNGVAIDIPQSLPPLSVEQETIDVEKSDFCLSSSDNEISPRPSKTPDGKPAKDHALVVILTKSPTVQGLHTPRVTSPADAPCSPGSAKRLWKREIRKSLFRTRNTHASPVSETAHPNVTLQAEAVSPIESIPEDASPWRNARSKSSIGASVEKKDAEQSTSQLIRLLWSRWTGGSSKGKRISHTPCEVLLTSHPCEATKASEITKADPQLDTKPPCKEMQSHTKVDMIEISHEEPALQEAALHFTKPPPDGAMNASSHNSPQMELKTEQTHSMELQIALDNPAIDAQAGPSEAEPVETPKLAIARADSKSVKNSNGLPRVKTTASPKSLPPGFHKGTNDTKPVIQTPRRSFRSSIPLASPPLRRSMSKPDGATRSFSGIGAIADQDAVTSTPSPQSKAVHEINKCINFCERDERPLIPGVTTLDWEKALREAAIDCLPPPNFREILQQCSTCGRTFKPDSLQVHRRGCHPPQYARAFSLRASPHMLRSRAA